MPITSIRKYTLVQLIYVIMDNKELLVKDKLNLLPGIGLLLYRTSLLCTLEYLLNKQTMHYDKQY